MATSKRSSGDGPDHPPLAEPLGRRELIIIIKPDAGLRVSAAGLVSTRGANTSALADVLTSYRASLEPLFGASEERIRASVAALPSADGLSGLELFYNVNGDDAGLEDLAEDLLAQDLVEAAYVKPAATVPQSLVDDVEESINTMLPDPNDAPPMTADFTIRQGYLDAAPGGIDARYAWTVPGGRGSGVRIIDCEWGWLFSHEDLLRNQGGVVAGTSSTKTRLINHGTAVLGEISGDRNTFGITGIAPDATVSASSFNDQNTATAIVNAADRLGAGDIILLEIHRAGPNAPTPRQGQLGFIAIEWWPDDFAAIRYAVNKGIIVVEAAGNGRQNLDSAIYSQRPMGFPTNWRNPFDPANPSSGAVVVGAGAPPPGTHGNSWGPDRSRLGFSNYGARVDAQGWGREVTTTGYGDLQGGMNAKLWYTDKFSGTSSASPIVVGALACMQGVLRAHGQNPLSPADAREMLRAHGSAQQDAVGRPATQRIGNRPDLREMIPAVLQWLEPVLHAMMR
jgi:hypothetical protein